jgi:DNA repair exonuclease SbcCD ATPase subunit
MKKEVQIIHKQSSTYSKPFENRNSSISTPNGHHLSKNYRSPESTPVSSPVPCRTVSSQEIFEYFPENTSKQTEIIIFLKQRIQSQDKRINSLEEENKKLSHMLWKNWELEASKLKNDQKTLDSIKNIRENNNLSDEIAKKDKKIANLDMKILKYKQKCEKYEKIITKLKNETIKQPDKEIDTLSIKIKDLEYIIELKNKENKDLKAEYSEYHKKNSEILKKMSTDISKIQRETQKLLKILENIKLAKEISLQGLLGIETDRKHDNADQINQDIQSIKSNMNKVLNLLSDIIAEQYGNTACNNQ